MNDSAQAALDAGRGAADLPVTTDVTVVVPVKDRETMIARALHSVARQTVAPVEVIVIDDGSTDATAQIARDLGARVIELPESGGSGPARNRGIEAASTTWIAFLDSDDEWDADHLERLMSGAGDAVLVTAPGRTTDRTIGNSSRRTLALVPRLVLTMSSLVCTSGTAVRRDALLAAGLFRPLARGQDMDMWLRVLEQGEGVALAEPSVTYHTHVGQVSLDRDLMRHYFEVILDHASDRPWFGPLDRDRASARVRWDELRFGLRQRDAKAVAQNGGWLVVRPHAWPPLLRLRRFRKMSRSR